MRMSDRRYRQYLRVLFRGELTDAQIERKVRRHREFLKSQSSIASEKQRVPSQPAATAPTI